VHRIRSHVARAVVATVVALAASSFVSASAGAAEPPAPAYQPPVDAPVVDPFRAPEHRWGPGNRGLTYEVAPGTPVRAAAAGTVTFAGPVAGSLHVTVLHRDGVRTSYSFLTEVGVRMGQRVDQGDAVGVAGGQLHLGARIGDTYFDPASLFEDGPVRVRLVPFDDPLPGGLGSERSAIGQLVGGVRNAIGGAVGWAADTTSVALHYTRRFDPISQSVRGIRIGLEAWKASRRECTEADTEVPPRGARRVAVLVGGLGSSSDDAAIDDLDTEAIGYASGDVIRFSYAGGRVPDPTDTIDAGIPRAYDGGHTERDLRESAELLADLVEDAVDASEGAEVDLLAHSQGGLVARLALAELDRRHGPEWLDRVGVLVTLGSPHGGADIATAVAAVRRTRTGRRVVVLASEALLGLDAGATSVAQLSESSDLIAELADTPPPEAVPFTSIGARGDLVVPVPRTRTEGATHVTVPLASLTAHDDLPGSSAATREVSLAVAGMAPGCIGFGGALLDRWAGEAISLTTDGAGAYAWVRLTLGGGT
jgi:hypothetical protein